MRTPSDVAFTSTVKALQQRHGSRRAYARMESTGGWASELSDELVDFIAGQRSFFLATANAEGQPYVQHRGGPRGFLRVLDRHTLAFADVAGNKQFISVGNLSENPKVHLFLIDYATRQRVKVWGTAKVIDDDPELLARLRIDGGGRAERAIVLHVTAWDANCPQHIPVLLEAEAVKDLLDEKDARIAELERHLRAR